MSSSASRRPRVAGQRRRPLRDGGPSDSSPGLLPPTKGGDHPTDDAVAPAVDEDDAADAGGATGADGATGPDFATGSDVAADPDPAEPRTVPSPSLRLPAIALAVCLALLAAVLLVTREDPGERPRAASAAAATARSTLEQILSYNHATMTQQLPASQALLTGAFREEFGATMTKTIVPLAQKDKTVVKARAYEVGVMSQTDDTVTVQAFVNQARTSDTQKEPSIDQNRVIATMSRSGNRWLVSSLKAY